MRRAITAAMHVRRAVDGDGDDRNAEDDGGNGMRSFVDSGSLAQTSSHASTSMSRMKSARDRVSLPSRRPKRTQPFSRARIAWRVAPAVEVAREFVGSGEERLSPVGDSLAWR